jgi:hypothetical protein
MADIFVRLHSDRLVVIVLDRFVVIVFESGGGCGNACAARTPGSGYRRFPDRAEADFAVFAEECDLGRKAVAGASLDGRVHVAAVPPAVVGGRQVSFPGWPGGNTARALSKS